MKQKFAADKILSEAAKTYAEKNAIYKSHFVDIGGAMNALFPNGVELKTQNDFMRFHILSWIVGKISRYATNWEKGHKDSIHDAVVYCAMLEAIDDELFKS